MRQHPPPGATIILLPGGAGGFGKLVNGKPDGRNFLVRSRDFFFAAGMNVAIIGKPSDKEDLDYPDRVAPEHLRDIETVVDFLKKDTQLPVWLVGTSRGTVSATAAAIQFGDAKLAGIVLSSSVVAAQKTGAVPYQNLAAIRIPVLIIHNEQDACKVCSPRSVPAIIEGLVNAPVKKLHFMTGSQNPLGDACEALHYHGFIDIEKPTVEFITNWIKNPQP